MRRWHYLATLTLGVGVAMASATGCELIASVDRSMIPTGNSGGNGQGGAGGTGGEPTTTGGGRGGAGGGVGGEGGGPAPTCTDGIENGNETDVDCGGDACPQCAQGQGCGVGTDCAGSGFCVDGVCCDNECANTCYSCNLPGTVGTCTVVPDGDDPDDDCADQAPETCGTTGTCDGAGSCTYHPFGTACAPAMCANGTLQNAQTCDGGGSCATSGTTSCGLYNCPDGSAACNTTCAASTDCAANGYCNTNSMCVVKKQNGANCQGNDHCVSGFCTDGVCCNAACGGECERCNAAGNLGTCSFFATGAVDPECTAPTTTCNAAHMCALPNGAACTMPSECASGNCTGSVCAP